ISAEGSLQPGGKQTILRKRYELFVCPTTLRCSHPWEFGANGELRSLDIKQC
ncbi:MAG: hypothetical protein EZS28_040585, partial [Streblomastix strix]